MNYLSRFLLLISCLMIVADSAQAVAVAVASAEDALSARSSAGRLALSRADIWERMWLSDFIDDTHEKIKNNFIEADLQTKLKYITLKSKNLTYE